MKLNAGGMHKGVLLPFGIVSGITNFTERRSFGVDLRQHLRGREAASAEWILGVVRLNERMMRSNLLISKENNRTARTAVVLMLAAPACRNIPIAGRCVADFPTARRIGESQRAFAYMQRQEARAVRRGASLKRRGRVSIHSVAREDSESVFWRLLWPEAVVCVNPPYQG
jgi:hypothetical protein